MSLPNTYRRLEYIQSSGTQWIDTGVIGSDLIGFEIDFATQDSFTSQTYGTIFGARNSSNSREYMLSSYSTSTIFGGTISHFNRQSANLYTDGRRQQCSMKNRVYTSLNGNTYTFSSTTTITPVNITIFALNQNGSKIQYGKLKLYSLKFYDNNTLIRDYIPVKRLSDSVVGLYDLVNNVFYTNAGSGTFIAGTEYKIVDGIVKPSGAGTITGLGQYMPNTNIQVNAIANSGYEFVNWTESGTIVSTSSTYTFSVSKDRNLVANFKEYTITINYDSTLGSASYEWGQGNNVILIANPNANAQFVGWYLNSQKLSSALTYQYEVSGDTTFEARFERVWDITTNTIGGGAIQFTRQSSDKNIVEFSVIPSANHHFVKYVVGDDEYTTTPLTLTLTSNITITAYFEEDDKFHITARADIPNASVYISENDVYIGTQITLFARPYPKYNFVKWSDGATENPRSIAVIQNITLVAEYSHEIETNGIYQYRCWVKDQMNMTQAPKSFMVVDTFTLNEDYLTNATSKIKVLKIADNINNGDVISVYNPKGEVIYNGVITSISENNITTSQMQSFYKGLWIYNTHNSTTLEAELKWLLGQYAQGKIYRSTYTDSLVAQRLGGITIRSVNATQVHLPTDLDKDGNEQLTQYDMEKFIYKMYQDYGIVFEFEINFSGANYVNIKVPTYTSIKVGNNHYAIQNLSPIQTIEETNRLIIYSKAKAYRTTYVATKQGIVEQPSSLANRFDITNTKVVFSDDNVADLVASNLPNTMFNHKITFTLFIKNDLYQYSEFILGMPLDIWYGSDYYSSVLTGRKLSKASNQNVSSVDYTCGLVRQALTKKITLGQI